MKYKAQKSKNRHKYNYKNNTLIVRKTIVYNKTLNTLSLFPQG